MASEANTRVALSWTPHGTRRMGQILENGRRSMELKLMSHEWSWNKTSKIVKNRGQKGGPGNKTSKMV